MKMAGTASAYATAGCTGAIATVFGESAAIGVGITTVGITTAGTTIAIELHWARLATKRCQPVFPRAR